MQIYFKCDDAKAKSNLQKHGVAFEDAKINNIPPLTDEQRVRLAALAARPDSEIDYSDIPETTDEFWKNAVRNPLYKPIKQATTVRVDADVLLWLKSQGKGYQTRINAILRQAMLRALEGKV